MRVFLVAALLLIPVTAAAQDIAAGQKAFAVCHACHDVGETAANKLGPRLNGVFGRKAAAVEGFSYSQVLKGSGIVWDDKTFSQFMADPRGFLPGNKMTFAGIKDPDKIANLAAYLKQFDSAGKTAAPPPAVVEAPAPPDPVLQACLQVLGKPIGEAKCAALGGQTLQAIGVLAAASPGGGYGTFDGGGLVRVEEGASPRSFHRLTLAAGKPCLADETAVLQDQRGGWAEVTVGRFDLRKIRRVRYLLKFDDYGSDASAAPTDPRIVDVVVEGSDWICRKTIPLDPSREQGERACEPKGYLLSTGEAETRAVVMGALAVLRKACGMPH